MKFFALVLLFSGCGLAQAAHTVTLTWADTLNPAGTTYNIYKATSTCSGTPSFVKTATGVTLKTWDDTNVQPGNYCYQVTSNFAGMESAPSNSAAAPVPSFPPSTLSVVVK